jgi:hypothetical protein
VQILHVGMNSSLRQRETIWTEFLPAISISTFSLPCFMAPSGTNESLVDDRAEEKVRLP